MFCRKCGTRVPEDSQFCVKCGQAVSVGSTTSGAAAAVAPAFAPAPLSPPAQKAKSKAAVWILAVIVAAVCWFAVRGSNPGAQRLRQAIAQQHTQTIKNPALNIRAGQYSYVKLTFPPGATGVHFQGSFTASGGSGNDVEAFVLPETDFVNWQNGHTSHTYYQSGRVTMGNINLNLPSDAETCYLVFSNKFSLFSEKTVRVEATLSYSQ